MRRLCDGKLQETKLELAGVELEIDLLMLRQLIRKGEGGGDGADGAWCGGRKEL